MRPRQTNQLGRVILVLHIVRFRVGIKPLHGCQNPRSVLVGARDLGGHLLAGSRRALAALALPNLQRKVGVVVRRGSRVIGLGGRSASAKLQALQETADARFFVHLHLLEVAGHGDRQLGGRCLLSHGDAMVVDVMDQSETGESAKVQANAARVGSRVRRLAGGAAAWEGLSWSCSRHSVIAAAKGGCLHDDRTLLSISLVALVGCLVAVAASIDWS
mmetsp:Transcript_2963/g.8305  ORF Transcript_2963/g.8305 Transcript_2963/m.8305 type:complete len:217 (-) Transcript_2963:122-772(-)